jgi:import inner membrane translocase subunit TIM21
MGLTTNIANPVMRNSTLWSFAFSCPNSITAIRTPGLFSRVRPRCLEIQRMVTRDFILDTRKGKETIESNSKFKSDKKSTKLVETTDQPGTVALSLGEKVKENAKTATYGSVIILGLVVTGAMAYVILSELFSPESPNNIYTKSFKLCKANQDIQDSLGSPIKCYGEETRRGWRRHVAHHEFFQDNVKYLRMRFYIEGKFNKGTVHVEKKTNNQGKYEYSYLIVDVDGYPPRRINLDVSNL